MAAFSSGPPGPPAPRFHTDPTNAATPGNMLRVMSTFPLDESFTVGESWHLQRTSCGSAVALAQSLPEDGASILLLTGALSRCAPKPALLLDHSGVAPRALNPELLAAIARLEMSTSVMDTVAPSAGKEGGFTTTAAEGWAVTTSGAGSAGGVHPAQPCMALPGQPSSPADRTRHFRCFSRELERGLLQQGFPPCGYSAHPQLQQLSPPLGSEPQQSGQHQQALLGLQHHCTQGLAPWDNWQWQHHQQQQQQLLLQQVQQQQRLLEPLLQQQQQQLPWEQQQNHHHYSTLQRSLQDPQCPPHGYRMGFHEQNPRGFSR
ncbi:hypothetical protein Vretimale_2989 [Volvox reticuliferus]|nr:hypothetical protein Vretifemale_6891 [Volvox reticuliferus]GIL97265.1 hypothetical protein Vretimale_2989 [Volvox reticuliferus]